MRVCLAGGIGNQLFQVAAGHQIGGEEQVEIVLNFGKYTDPAYQMRELSKIVKLDLKLFESQRSPNFIEEKCWNVLMGISTGESGFRKTIFNNLSKKKLAGYFQINSTIVGATTLGFDPKLRSANSHETLVGYFQSYEWASRSTFKEYVVQPSEPIWLRQSSESANRESVIAVHVRLGDYRNNPKLGILNKKYYEMAIARASEISGGGQIWLFSNEPDSAKEWIPKKYLKNLYVIPNEKMSPADTLNLMRLASVNVIANSTFSWWGGFLNANNSQVICPSKWFRSRVDPGALIPDHWIKVENGWI
jgi:hypothetical protein